MRPLVLAFACLPILLLAGCAGKGPQAGEAAGHDPDSSLSSRTYTLNARLAPPVTTYNITATSPTFGLFGAPAEVNSSGYSYTWTNTNACGRFTTSGGTAVWEHGDDTNCPHDSPHHEGTVRVIIGNLSESTASTGYATCEWAGGSNTGSSPACTVSSVAPEGLPKARGTSIPWSTPVALVALGAAALVAVRRR